MWGVDEIKSYLKDNLKPSRYGHTLGVVKTAIELAGIYNEDKQKAEIAALCHDIAKNMSYEDMLKVIEEENLKLSNDEKNSKELWHSIRDISRKNLNDAVLKALTHTIMYLLTKDCAVDLNSIKARNYLIYNS